MEDTLHELESLGFGALWVPESGSNVILDVASRLLGASNRLVVATAILNIWMHRPAEVAKVGADFAKRYPDRFLLGLGASHRHLVETDSRRYERPYSVMVEFLDQLDQAGAPVGRQDRVLAALGPRMLKLAGDRALGAHPYCVPVEHTAIARETLGNGPLLAPELKVVLDTDPQVVRSIARAHLEHYLEAPNYANNLLRLGWSEDDLEHGGSDKLVDALVAWGTPEQIAKRCSEHLDAGADHVCLQVLNADPSLLAAPQWQALAPAVLG